MRAVWLVAQRELQEAFRRKSFWIVVLVVGAASVAAVILPQVLSGDDGPTVHDVGIVGGDLVVRDAIVASADALDVEVDFVPLRDHAAAVRAVEDDRVDIAAEPGDEPRLVIDADGNDRLEVAVGRGLAEVAALRQLQAEGLTPREAGDALAAASQAPRVVEIDADDGERRAASFFVSLILYLLLFTVMMQVATAVAVEKSTRVSEVLLAIVRPRALLLGKVIGVGALGIVTLSAAIIPVAISLASGGDLPAGIGGALLGGGAWALIGLAVYLLLAAALGSLADRQEEAGTIVTPLMLVLIGSYLVAQSAPDTTLGQVLAYVPLSSPVVLPARVALGVSSGFEIAASLVLGVLGVVASARLAGVVYGRAIVRTGRRLRLREVLG